MQVEAVIRTKRAVRQFTDTPLPAADEQAIFEAGRRAQSSKNTQPWQFIAIHDRATLQALATYGTYAGHLAGAALGVVIVATPGNEFDIGQAAAYMQLAAWDRGIGSCIASIYEPAKARTLLGIPDTMTVAIALSFGYPQPVPAPKKPLARRSLTEIVHQEHW